MWVLLLLAYCLWDPAAALAQATDEGDPAADAATISTESDTATDAAIKSRIESIYAEVDNLGSVQVAVREGVVTLSGAAPNDAHAERAVSLARRLSGVVTVEDNIERTLGLEENLTPLLGELTDRLSQWSRALPLFLLATGIFLIVAYAGHLLAKWEWLWVRIAPNLFLAELLAQTFRVVAIAIGLILALNVFGATTLTKTILGGAGVVGIAIGFAIRDTLENYIASILLSVRQPFRANDHVRINDHEGKVVRLTSRATVLLTLDGNHLRIPNSTVFKAVILNFTRNPERRFDFELGVDAEDDPMAALQQGIDAISQLEFVLDEPQPAGHIVAVGDSNIVLRFQGWVDQRDTDFLKARSRAIRVAKDALEQSGFTLPEPIYRLRLDNVLPGNATRWASITEDTSSTGEDLAGDQAAGDAPSPPADEDLSVRPERHLDARIDEERAADAETDLLDSSKPTE